MINQNLFHLQNAYRELLKIEMNSPIRHAMQTSMANMVTIIAKEHQTEPQYIQEAFETITNLYKGK